MDRSNVISVLVAVALLVLSIGLAQADERISDFHSDIQVLRDGSLKVVETITVRAEGRKIKRGIHRDFPVAYTSKYLVPIRLPFDVVSVKRDGATEPFHTRDESNGVQVYIGRENRHIPLGNYVYEITYTTNFQLGYFDTHDELYWNVTGNGWEFPIDRASASVSLPADVSRDKLTHEGYTGPQGWKKRNLISEVNEATGDVDFATTKSLALQEGLTIVVGFPKGHVHEPTAVEKSAIYFRADLTLWVVLGGLLVVLTYYVIAWIAVGRDPPGDAIYPSFEPPLELSPACMRYLRRMAYDKKCSTAALISMAVKRQIRIDEEDGEFTLRRADSPDEGCLSPGEKKIFRSLFVSSSIVLKQSNHKRIGAAITRLGEWLSHEFEGVLFVRNGWWLVPGWLLSALAIAAVALTIGGEALPLMGFLSLWLSIWTLGCVVLGMQVVASWRNVLTLRKKTLHRLGSFGGAIFITAFATPFFVAEVIVLGVLVFQVSIWMAPLLLGLVAINWGFWHWIKQPTVDGQRVMDLIEGFRMYLETAEEEFLRRMHPPELTPELFEKYLPFPHVTFSPRKRTKNDRCVRTIPCL